MQAGGLVLVLLLVFEKALSKKSFTKAFYKKVLYKKLSFNLF